jgi:hypothetical protein
MTDFDVLKALKDAGGEAHYRDLVKSLGYKRGDERKLDRSLKRLLKARQIRKFVYPSSPRPEVTYCISKSSWDKTCGELDNVFEPVIDEVLRRYPPWLIADMLEEYASTVRHLKPGKKETFRLHRSKTWKRRMLHERSKGIAYRATDLIRRQTGREYLDLTVLLELRRANRKVRFPIAWKSLVGTDSSVSWEDVPGILDSIDRWRIAHGRV